MGIRQAEGRENGVGRRRGGADKQIDRQLLLLLMLLTMRWRCRLALPFSVLLVLCVID